MTFKEKYLLDHPEKADRINAIIYANCPATYNYEGYHKSDYCRGRSCDECWDREMPGTENEKEKDMIIPANGQNNPIEDIVKTASLVADLKDKPHILDSGNRREFESGAVRDIQEGKGRCDLLPLDVVARYYAKYVCYPNCGIEPVSVVLSDICAFLSTGIAEFLVQVLRDTEIFTDFETMILEVAIHFEEGAKKYGDNNWQKGIPVRCYIDSAVRHYLKFLRGDKDEPHDRAFCWNILCAIWTCKHKPELNEYAEKTT